jgi:hypothetical protein
VTDGAVRHQLQALSQPQTHTVHVHVASDGMTELMFGKPIKFDVVELTVTLGEDEPLRPVVMAAVDQCIQVWLQQVRVPYEAFQMPLAVGDGDDPFELGQGFAIAANGRAQATYGLADEPFGNLVRAFELQLIPADPHEIRVLLRVPTAGVGGAGWESFEAGVKWFLQWWPEVGGVYASFAVLSKAVERFRRAADVLLRHKRDLEEHGFTPPDPVRLAATKRWKLSELAELLGTTSDEASDLLVAFGFFRDEGGTWRSPPALNKELAMIFLTALTSYDAIKRDEAPLAERLRHELDDWVSAVRATAEAQRRSRS